MDKAKAIFDFVADHTEYGKTIFVPPIERMIEILRNGGKVRGIVKYTPSYMLA